MSLWLEDVPVLLYAVCSKSAHLTCRIVPAIIAAAVVGGVVGLVLLIILICCCCWCRRRRQAALKKEALLDAYQEHEYFRVKPAEEIAPKTTARRREFAEKYGIGQRA